MSWVSSDPWSHLVTWGEHSSDAGATFTPPTVKQPIGTGPLLSRYNLDVGQSVVRKNGVLTLTPFPWIGDLEDLTEGTDYFMGGRTYPVTDAVAAELTTAGFTVG